MTPECTLSHSQADNKIYLITTQNRSLPAAAFLCRHCAEIWFSANLPYGQIIPLKLDADLVSNLINHVADIEVVHNTDNTLVAPGWLQYSGTSTESKYLCPSCACCLDEIKPFCESCGNPLPALLEPVSHACSGCNADLLESGRLGLPNYCGNCGLKVT